MDATAVGDQVSEELQDCHGHVESGSALEIPVPYLTHHVHDELHTPLVGGVMQNAIGTISWVVGFQFPDFRGCCILRDAIVIYIFSWAGRQTWHRIVWCSRVPRK